LKKSVLSVIVLLVVFTISITFVPSVKSQVESVEILDYSYYIDMFGNLIVVGEVQNIGTKVLSYVDIAGRITGSDGSQAQWENRVLGLYLLPQQKAPFYLQFSSQSTYFGSWFGIDIVNVELVAYKAPETTKYQYQNVIVTTHQGSANSVGEYWVNGELKNTGTQTAGNITIVATYYNSSGVPIAFGGTNRISTLSPNATKTFKVGAFDLNQTEVSLDKKISGYSLLVQAESPLSEGTVPTASSAPAGTSEPTNSASSSGNDLNTTNIVIVVVVIAVAAVVLLLISKSRKKEASSKKPKQSHKIGDKKSK
jgi:hypothetical protein